MELTPGLAAASSCPEAIYQAAKWWSGYYQQTAGPQTTGTRRRRKKVDEPPTHPTGRYLLRQREATYVEPKPVE